MKIRFLVFFLSGFLCFAVSAQVTQRNILATKYSLAAIQKSLLPYNEYRPYPKSPEEWRKKLPDTAIASIIKLGESKLNFKFESIPATVVLLYKRTGDRSQYSNLSNKKRDALVAMALAESVEGKGRFVDAILNGTWSICEESYWGISAHIGGTGGVPNVEKPFVDLFSAETASALALVYYWVGDQMKKVNPLFTERIYNETQKRIFTPLMGDISGYGYLSTDKPVNNWNPWIMSNWLFTNLMMVEKQTYRTEMAYKAMTYLDRYFNSLGDDGGCDEGPGYWNAAGGSAFDCLELLQNATNNAVNIFDHPLIQKMGSYIYKVHIANKYFVNMGDASPKITVNSAMIYRFGTAVKDNQLMDFALSFDSKNKAEYNLGGYSKMRLVNDLFTREIIRDKKNQYKQPESAWIGDIQMMVARSKDGLFLAAHGGHNGESHNHNDVGDFIVYFNNQPFIIDVGSTNYTAKTFSAQRYDLWPMQSQYHNLPTVNGYAQQAGSAFEATEVANTINQQEAKLQLNLAKAYPKESGLLALKRELTLNKLKNWVKISDNYQFDKLPTSITQGFMTVATVDTTEAGKLQLIGDQNATLVLEYDPAVLSLSIDIPSIEGQEYSNMKEKWDGKVIKRVLFTAIKPLQTNKLDYFIHKK